MKTKYLYIFSIFFLTSCSVKNKKHFEYLKGEWQVIEFYHKKENIGDDGQYLIGFEKDDHLWLTKLEDANNNFISSDYEIVRKRDSLMIEIRNCEDARFDGYYDFYIDTIQEFKTQHIIQLTFDSENTYIKAQRLKNK
ncbi:hypothetical protein [Flavobacterium sp. N2270]|jgi:hypothetical protein|uniref:hypothetical protein n=1 Tax=Flavobacterium sp. N2270 TaxID=2986831 RepID=UPI0022244A63|nr:hypothetical protein [Flavobacterium sp. N2270]